MDDAGPAGVGAGSRRHRKGRGSPSSGPTVPSVPRGALRDRPIESQKGAGLISAVSESAHAADIERLWEAGSPWLKRTRKMLDAFVFNRHITVKKALNLGLVFFQHQFLKNSRVYGHPVRLVIEPTNHCNLSCPLCPAGRDNKGHERGMMKLEDFKAIIDEVGEYLFEIDLYDFGESLLNPRIYEMIEY